MSLGRIAVLLLPFALAACSGSGDEGSLTLTVSSSAMEPTLHCARSDGYGCEGEQADEIIVVSNSHVERGDIVAFSTPPKAQVECGLGGTFVKRLIGLPGERIRERSGVFYVGTTASGNGGRKLDDFAYVKPDRRDDRSGYWVVPKASYFVVGDNRTQSCDSRRWGSVPKENIQGKVTAIARPSGRINLP